MALAATFAAGSAPSQTRSEVLNAAATRGISVRVVAAQERSAVFFEAAAVGARADAMELASAKAAAPQPRPPPRHPPGISSTRRPRALRAAGVPCDIYAAACVSLSKQEAWLLRGGRVVYGPVRVATGRAGLPTPTGNFRVWYKVVNGWSSTYDAPMPYSVFFYEGDAFHEDPVTVRSHGCVHLSLANAEHFYRFLQYGNLVEVRD